MSSIHSWYANAITLEQLASVEVHHVYFHSTDFVCGGSNFHRLQRMDMLPEEAEPKLNVTKIVLPLDPTHKWVLA